MKLALFCHWKNKTLTEYNDNAEGKLTMENLYFCTFNHSTLTESSKVLATRVATANRSRVSIYHNY